MNTDKKALKESFYDIKTGFISFEKLYQKVKEKGIKLTRKEVKEFYDSQPIKQVLKPIIKQKKYSSVLAFGTRNIYQMDIIVYDRYEFKKYKYMLVVIDIYSRYLQVRPMTNRRMDTIIKNYKSITDVMGIPEYLQSDNEFNKKDFLNILEKDKTKFIFSQPDEIHKNAIVERVNRTIALMIQKVRIALKRYDWNKFVFDLVDNYNNTIHSSIKAKPHDVFFNKDFSKQKYIHIQNPFSIGDKVRIKYKKKIFDKGDVITLSENIYVIEEIKRNKMLVNGKYYKSYELDKIENVDIDMDDVEQPKTKTKMKNINNKLKRENIEQSNIIRKKRISQPVKK